MRGDHVPPAHGVLPEVLLQHHVGSWPKNMQTVDVAQRLDLQRELRNSRRSTRRRRRRRGSSRRPATSRSTARSRAAGCPTCASDRPTNAHTQEHARRRWRCRCRSTDDAVVTCPRSRGSTQKQVSERCAGSHDAGSRLGTTLAEATNARASSDVGWTPRLRHAPTMATERDAVERGLSWLPRAPGARAPWPGARGTRGWR